MKKYFSILTMIVVVVCLSGCTKFEPATVDLNVSLLPVGDGTVWFDCKGEVTNNGGCKYFNEMGFLYSLDPDPTYKADNVTTIAVEKNIETTTFNHTYTSVMTDTVYFVRAYVCTNAGTGYSETKNVSTYLSK